MSVGAPEPAEYFAGRSTADRPFVPIIGTLAAAINQVSPERFLSDATQLANGLQRARRLFELDAVCVVPDPVLIAEALGVPVAFDEDGDRFCPVDHADSVDMLLDPDGITDAGRVPVVLDAADRLVTSTDDDVAVIGVLPGVHTTFEAVFGGTVTADDPRTKLIRTATGEVARAFGQAGVDALLVAESQPVGSADRVDDAAIDTSIEALGVIDNIGEFFRMPLAFAPGGHDPAALEAIVDGTAVDAVFLNTDDPSDMTADIDGVRVGGGVTRSLLDESPDEIKGAIEATVADLPSDAFLASGIEITSDVHPRKLQAIHRAVEAAAY